MITYWYMLSSVTITFQIRPFKVNSFKISQLTYILLSVHKPIKDSLKAIDVISTYKSTYLQGGIQPLSPRLGAAVSAHRACLPGPASAGFLPPPKLTPLTLI